MLKLTITLITRVIKIFINCKLGDRAQIFQIINFAKIGIIYNLIHGEKKDSDWQVIDIPLILIDKPVQEYKRNTLFVN